MLIVLSIPTVFMILAEVVTLLRWTKKKVTTAAKTRPAVLPMPEQPTAEVLDYAEHKKGIIEEEVERVRRDPEFQKRLSDSLERNRPILDKLREEGD